MTISEVMRQTGLTKRAIRYYEEEGLINPSINNENSYRDYHSEDIDKLIKISLLRQIGLSIDNIKELVNSPTSINDVLKLHLDKINRNIKDLEKSKNLINEIIENNKINSTNDFMEKLKSLKENIELEDKNKFGYIKRQLLKIFPGSFGKMLILHFSPFLNDPVDDEDKEKAWNDIVKFLDEAEPFNYPQEFYNNSGDFSDDVLEKIAAENNKEIQSLLNYTPQELEEYKIKFMESLNSMNENKDFVEIRQKMWKSNLDFKNRLQSSGYYDRFVNNLRILSSDYDKYQTILQKLNDELGLYYDSDGNIAVNSSVDQK
ncbi:MerR family transcriptional regulator [Pseudobacteroides cellulosolvens]|uniref:Transcriptional regulator, MerR family n=1 Tax=Pseudobacteroides cellulosolvens ATCC 35603 = DSM 2933 TaxID=398512 RepID=A0A0L6JWM6_9FIRM|nr:MerR family transcriptional regulator [Pseudobacteroides cellulosolvens]KNY29832.1 transcriptional regulator, MerR family [Pseudobacteroides cellulosolvens ATCC 35603 = DSM 2933]